MGAGSIFVRRETKMRGLVIIFIYNSDKQSLSARKASVKKMWSQKHPRCAKHEKSRAAWGGAGLPKKAEAWQGRFVFTAVAKAKSHVPAPKSEGRAGSG
jgi:hypothetical protein